MGHGADSSFFETKRAWSERKDLILRHYLTPYLPKVATQRRPILIVDGFAGPGSFGDGKPGSPIIICDAIASRPPSMAALEVRALFIEKDQALYARLTKAVQDRLFASTLCKPFLEAVDEIHEAARSRSTFLYIDPFTVKGLQWAALERVFRLVSQGLSVEVLLNLNVDSFCRRGLAALARPTPAASDDLPESDDEGASEVDTLDDIAGGDWWQAILRGSGEYATMCSQVTDQFCRKFRTHFAEVCFHPVKELTRHKVPKYVLVFGSRHSDALRLMNDAMCKSRDVQADREQPTEPTLFETRSETLVPDVQKLPDLVLSHLQGQMTRGTLILKVIRSAFCQYPETEIRQAIKTLIRDGSIVSETRGSKINDEVRVWRP